VGKFGRKLKPLAAGITAVEGSFMRQEKLVK